MPDNSLKLTSFDQVDLADKFFDTLKEQYQEFPDWFAKKQATKEPVYVVNEETTGALRGFVYLKVEEGEIHDVSPSLPAARRIKVGTLKINAHGTKLGERVIKKIFDHALQEDAEEIYVTVFDTHAGLIKLFEKYGFIEKGRKKTDNGEELVFVRDLTSFKADIVEDFPFINTGGGTEKFLLAIKPGYHTNLFPDSMLTTEKSHIVEDVSHTNTIHKVYIGGCPTTRMKRGDIVVMYRTTDITGKAWFRSVATSICVVEDTRSRRDFASEADFLRYALPHSVFSEAELKELYQKRSKPMYVVKMMYNAALPKRPNRAALMEGLGMTDPPRFDFRKISDAEFNGIVGLSELNSRLIIP